MKRAIITGATGAIGNALIKNLLREDIEILVIARKGSARNAAIPCDERITVLYSSLDELNTLQNNTGKQYDVFYHFAWDKTFGAWRDDYYCQESNIKYTLDAVAAAKRFGCHTFIGAGSQAEYGRFEGKLAANTPTFPENGYGMAKLCAGQMSRGYAHSLGLKHIWVRILSVYGPHDGEKTMVMSTINKLKNGEVAEFTKGEQLWDYLYSDDAGEAFLKLGDRGMDGKTYVLGSGRASPLREYIEIIGKTLHAEHLLRIGALPYSDRQVMHLCADITELTHDTGWTPKTNFEDGIMYIIKTMGGGVLL